MKHNALKLDSVIRQVLLKSPKTKFNIHEQGGFKLRNTDSTAVVKNKDTNNTNKNTNTTTNKKDKWGRSKSDKWYGYDPTQKIFVAGQYAGKTAAEAGLVTTKQNKNKNFMNQERDVDTGNLSGKKYSAKDRAKKMYDCKQLISDSEDFYRNLIVGSKPERIAGGVLSDGIAAIANEKEWDAVEKALKRLTGNRGIVQYGASFIDRSNTKVWVPIFNWMGKILGGDRVEEELGYTEFSDSKFYKKIAEKYANINPYDDADEPEKIRRRDDARANQQRSGVVSGTPLGVKLLLAVLVVSGVGMMALKLFWKSGAKSIRNLWQNKIRPITEEEILALKKYVEEQHTEGNIAEADMEEWNKFFRQKKWMGLNNKREELNSVLNLVKKGPNKPANWTRYWDGISMETFIKKYLPDYAQFDKRFKEMLLKYEKDVLEPWRQKTYNIEPEVKTPVKKEKPSSSSGTEPTKAKRVTRFSVKPVVETAESAKFTKLRITGLEKIPKDELIPVFSEFSGAEQFKKPGSPANEAWKETKQHLGQDLASKTKGVWLLNTHIEAGQLPAYANWKTDLVNSKFGVNFDQLSETAIKDLYKRQKIYLKIYKMAK